MFVGIAKQDTERDADYLVRKFISLRLFPDEAGKMNRSLREVEGAVLIVSNFTLYGDVSRGTRPSFDQAAKPDEARRLYEYFVAKVRESGLPVETGVFQAHMRVMVENDGPVTLISDSNGQSAGVRSASKNACST